MILLFSLFLRLYQLVLDSKDAIMVFFNFLNFFAIFLEFFITGRVGVDRNDNFYFHSFSGISQPFLDWKEAKIRFFNFLNFFAIFFEFSITGQVANNLNDHFSFIFFLAFPKMFGLLEKPQWCFIISWIFLLFFSNSLVRVGWQLIGTIIFIFSLSRPFPTWFGLKRSRNSVFEFFWNFL